MRIVLRICLAGFFSFFFGAHCSASRSENLFVYFFHSLKKIRIVKLGEIMFTIVFNESLNNRFSDYKASNELQRL